MNMSKIRFNVILIFSIVFNNSECRDDSRNGFFSSDHVQQVGRNIYEREDEDFFSKPSKHIPDIVKRNEVCTI